MAETLIVQNFWMSVQTATSRLSSLLKWRQSRSLSEGLPFFKERSGIESFLSYRNPRLFAIDLLVSYRGVSKGVAIALR